MHEGMAINFTGDQNYDFIAGMIPHHQVCDKTVLLYD
jgi:uncharacterized protein (DUF305 family)